MKDNKAVGGDGIPSEVWKYGRRAMKEWVRRMCEKMWKEEG